MSPTILEYLDCGQPQLGAVYGVLLNYRVDLQLLGARLHEQPYKAPPQAPVLYVKPRNTWTANGTAIPLPAEHSEVQVCASLGLVIGRTACRIAADAALDYLGGLTVVNEVCLPHTEVFRPALRQRCRDQFCPIGPWIVAAEAETLQSLRMCTYINGELRYQTGTADLLRPIGALIAAVSEFMSLHPGDVLTLGAPLNAPLAAVGDAVVVEIAGIGRLENAVVREREWRTQV